MEKKFISIQTTEDDKLQVGASPNLDFNTTLQMLHTLNLHMLNAFARIYATQIEETNKKLQPKKPITQGKDKGKHASSALNKEELKEAIYQAKLQIYDSFNVAASSILELFMPEANDYLDDVTAEAIKEVELKILEERINTLKETQPENYQANVDHYNRIKEKIVKQKEQHQDANQNMSEV